jgi:hypothetical protein
MHEDKKKQAFPRDRKGEIFQDDLGEDHTAFPDRREDAAHEVNMDEEVNSQEADEFMKRQFGKNEPAKSENPREPRRP